jgi:D-alanyl-lipoteichoic acid acyltransferase DltB (MBOAT superfamily)
MSQPAKLGHVDVRPIATHRPASIGGFLITALQVALVVLLIRAFRIEEAFGFVTIAPLLLVGFLVNAWLPLRFRLPFFVALTFAAVFLVFGAKYGGVIIVIGLGFLALCHLPIPYRWRVGLVVTAGAGLALVRGEVLPAPGAVASVVAPILGALFMFRMVVYLYDLRNERGDVSVWQRIGYFFLLPNICFPLFPVVDYQTFKRTYYDRPALDIYQKGALWVVRGITHLVAYRIIYQHLLPSPQEVASLGGVVQYITANYGLYLRISGQFHLVVGILCLFGFNLPETHHLYYLANGFTDYWRRINIYWKDFMTKIFYFPAMMRFKRFGMRTAMVLSTAVVFVATWLLHSYQWFWLRGAFPITATDMVFWGILGGFVVLASLREASRPRRKAPSQQTWSTWGAVVLSARVVGMFALLCVLWSLWSSPSIGRWASVMAQAGNSSVGAWALLVLGLAALVLVGVLVQYMESRGLPGLLVGSQPAFVPSAAYATTLAVALLVVATPALRGGSSNDRGLLASILEDRLNAQDLAKMERGYYEDLLDAPSYTAALDRVRNQAPPDWVELWETGYQEPTEDLTNFVLKANVDGLYKEASFHTNRWGMRGRDYALEKPEGTLRIAAVGASHEMGAGVDDDQVFLSLLEQDLNERRPIGFDHYEVLNFAVAGYSLLQRREIFLRRALEFDPDVLLVLLHDADAEARLFSLREGDAFNDLVRQPGLEPLAAIIDAMALTDDLPREEVEARFRGNIDPLLAWLFQDLAATCAERGIVPVVAYVPATQETPDVTGSSHLLAIAEREGWTTLNLYDAYEGLATRAIQLRPWDFHPNVDGHRRLAEQLYDALVARAPSLTSALAPSRTSRTSGSPH